MKRRYWGQKGEPGPERERSSVKVEDVMARPVLTVTRHQTVGHARELMSKHAFHSIPVVDQAGEPVGIVTSTDLIGDIDDATKLGLVMTRDVVRVSQFAAPQAAAALMRKHHIHHLVVTNEQRVTGILSSFDLLALLEDKRFAVRARVQAPKKATWEKQKQKEDEEPGP